MLDVKTILYIGLGLALSFILFDPMTVFYMGLGLSLILIITAGVALPFSKTLQNKVFPRPQESLMSDLLPFHHFMDDYATTFNITAERQKILPVIK